MKLDFNFQVNDSFGKVLGDAKFLLIKIFEEIPNGIHADKIRVLRKKLLLDGLLDIDEVDFKIVLNILNQARNTVTPILLEGLLLYVEVMEKALEKEKELEKELETSKNA